MINDKKWVAAAVFVYSVMFLFFLQLLADFIAGIYALALTGGSTDIPMEIGMIVVFLSPFILLLFRRGLSGTALIILAVLVLICRSVEIMLPTTPQMYVAGIGTGLFLFLFPAILWKISRDRLEGSGAILAAGLLVATSFSILLRTLGWTMDLTNVGMFRAVAWILAVGAALLLPRVINAPVAAREAPESEPGSGSWGRSIATGFGVTTVFALLFFAFASPEVITRWTNAEYLLVIAVAAAALAVFAWLGSGERTSVFIRPGVVPAITAVFALALVLTIWANQPVLPVEPSGFPYPDPQVGPFWTVTLLAALLLFPVLFLDFGLFGEETIVSRPTLGKLGLGFGLGSLFMLIMILANVFTSTWSYIDPVTEPLFRNRFWHVHAIVALALVLAVLVVSRRAYDLVTKAFKMGGGRWVAGLVTVSGLIAVIGVILYQPDPQPADSAESLSVAGYNILQGYNEAGQRGNQEQCDLLKEVDADVVALSESDTARIAGGNFDVVTFMAQCLNMHDVIGPRTPTGTFGYAILSKYPVENVEVFHLYSGARLPSSNDPQTTSGGDQTALLKGEIRKAGKTYNIIVVHNDSNPPVEQPEGLVSVAFDFDNVIAVGDFNCSVGSRCFEVVSAELEHCALQIGEPELVVWDIDHIFVSPELKCANFRYVESPASDHPLVAAEID